MPVKALSSFLPLNTCTKTWRCPPVDPAVRADSQPSFFGLLRLRLVAEDVKATRSQPPSVETSNDGPLACLPSLFTETRVILPLPRLRTNASATPLVSPGTRFDASETNARQSGFVCEEPSIAGLYEGPFAGCPAIPVEASSAALMIHGEPLLAHGAERRTK